MKNTLLIFVLTLCVCCSDNNPTEPDNNIVTMTGNDGTVYQTIKIGDKWWMAENLKETLFRNGDFIPERSNHVQWRNHTTGARCSYQNNENNANIYGYLYNWYAVIDSRNIAPQGWHVPTDEEWKQLEIVLGMNQAAADSLNFRGTNEGSKLAGNAIYWYDGDLKNDPAFDESGFSAVPAGIRNYLYGEFSSLRVGAWFWSSTEVSDYAWSRNLFFYLSGVNRESSLKNNGYSIRLVKD
jgi:uncharacterized protein (TIGR02145 family)